MINRVGGERSSPLPILIFWYNNVKKFSFVKREMYTVYEAPEMEIMEVMVEQGFAVSDGNLETPGQDDEEAM